jgi:steroid 5-alpha reductase family enzyme
MTVELFELFGVSFLSVMLVMTLIWGLCCFYKNIGIVDIGWALSFVLVGIVCFIFGDGNLFKRVAITSMVLIWSGRLAWHLWQRFAFDKEDPRYTELMSKFGEDNYDLKAWMMVMFQGLLVVILSLPFIIVCGYAERLWSLYEVLGILIFAIGLYGESLADMQLEAFKKKVSNKGKVCKRGLWKYSRHPNYFFEWVIWVGFFIFAFPTQGGIFALSSPLIMLVLLTRVSGIPLAEKQALKSKGEAYVEYQKTTSAFVPWFPSKS